MSKIVSNYCWLSIALVISGCSGTYSGGVSEGYPSRDSVDIEEFEPENPYSSSEEGHNAGFEWAEENDVESCDGNSESFIEGCEEYLSQKEGAEEVEEYDESYDSEYP